MGKGFRTKDIIFIPAHFVFLGITKTPISHKVCFQRGRDINHRCPPHLLWIMGCILIASIKEQENQ